MYICSLLMWVFIHQAYRSSMLKSFRKTLDEGAFPFVIGMIFLRKKHGLILKYRFIVF